VRPGISPSRARTSRSTAARRLPRQGYRPNRISAVTARSPSAPWKTLPFTPRLSM